MQKVTVLLMATLVALSFGLGLVWPTPAEKADRGQVSAAAAEPTREAFPKNLTGEVVSVEKGRRPMTVQPSGWFFTSGEVTFAVAEPVVPMLAELQPGDLVRVGYVEAHGQFIARAITKILAEPEKVGRSH